MEKLNLTAVCDCTVFDRDGNRLDRHRRRVDATAVTEVAIVTDEADAGVVNTPSNGDC
jgi:hypothetical protein